MHWTMPETIKQNKIKFILRSNDLVHTVRHYIVPVTQHLVEKEQRNIFLSIRISIDV